MYLRSEQLTFFQELFGLQKIVFKQYIQPGYALGDPILVIFSEGSQEALEICGKIWKSPYAVKSGRNYKVLATWLPNFINEESRLKFEKEYFSMDSQIVKAMLKKESYGFNTFVPVKVREIKSTADPNDLFLIEGEINMAD